MSKVHRNFLFSYLLLVILPVFCLLGILKYGRKLTAPLSVGGVWKIDADMDSQGDLPCGALYSSLRNASIVISQSGKNLTLTLPGGIQATASGIIDGATLTASFLPIEVGASGAECGLDRALSLTATVDANSTPRSFAGTFSVLGCQSCVATAVRATRQEQREAQSETPQAEQRKE
jgi:hypothetical protein